MTDISTDAAKALEGVTPGPWQADSAFCQGDHAVRIAMPDWAGVPQATVAECDHNWLDADCGERRISWKEAEANARFIAWCREGVPALVAELTAQTARAEAADAQVADLTVKLGAMTNRKGFPILGQRGVYVDWQLVSDHGGQANTNHGQTVARLSERGGLSWCELFAVLHNQRWQKMDANEAMIACRALEARYLAALKPGGAA
jgi:hypothetical protein